MVIGVRITEERRSMQKRRGREGAHSRYISKPESSAILQRARWGNNTTRPSSVEEVANAEKLLQTVLSALLKYVRPGQKRE